MHSVGELHRSFAAKSAAQDDNHGLQNELNHSSSPSERGAPSFVFRGILVSASFGGNKRLKKNPKKRPRLESNTGLVFDPYWTFSAAPKMVQSAATRAAPRIYRDHAL